MCALRSFSGILFSNNIQPQEPHFFSVGFSGFSTETFPNFVRPGDEYDMWAIFLAVSNDGIKDWERESSCDRQLKSDADSEWEEIEIRVWVAFLCKALHKSMYVNTLFCLLGTRAQHVSDSKEDHIVL